MLDGFWYHFWCFSDTFTVRICNLLNRQKPLFFQWISMISLFREIWFLMISLIFFDTSSGIDFWSVLASISASFWEPVTIIFMFFRHLFLHRFFIDFLVGNGTKMCPRLNLAASPFGIFFDHTCTFYRRNTYKCQKQFFKRFSKKLKEFVLCIWFVQAATLVRIPISLTFN